MIKGKTFLVYFIVIALFCAFGWYVLEQGFYLENFSTQVMQDVSLVKDLPGNIWHQLVHGFMSNLHHPLAVFIIQLVIIVFVARVFGYLFTKIRQPSVIGEIVAGIVLGPSLAGMYFPEFSAIVFPAESLPFLQFFSQIGLMLFMFIIGMEVDIKTLKNRDLMRLLSVTAALCFAFFLELFQLIFSISHLRLIILHSRLSLCSWVFQ